MTEAERLLRRAAYCRDQARRGRLRFDDLARTDAQKKRLGRYLDGLETEALGLENQAAESPPRH